VNVPFGGAVAIADTSAVVHANHHAVRDEIVAALQSGQLVTCSMVTFELLYAAPNASAFDAVERAQAVLRDIPVTSSVQRAAIGALRELAQLGAGNHRVTPADALIAAAAAEAGMSVLHYDHHFDRLASVLNFNSIWLASPGTLETHTSV